MLFFGGVLGVRRSFEIPSLFSLVSLGRKAWWGGSVYL
jgi:hypothetical protein